MNRFDKLDPMTLQPIVQTLPYPPLFVTVSGAHLYGFPSPDSDVDVRTPRTSYRTVAATARCCAPCWAWMRQRRPSHSSSSVTGARWTWRPTTLPSF
ncbi:MAG: nucleotidyltransferase domain-containing protein [Chloroflexota bacterium]|nr:nucleotidyltransferase domain-containing protein [Chloroflexota bacterium]